MTIEPARFRMCDYADFDKANLFRHLKRHHPEAIDEQGKASELDQNTYENIWIRGDPHPSGTNGYAQQGCYKCDFCGYSNYDRADLNLHMERFHREKATEQTKKRFVSEMLPEPATTATASTAATTEPIATTQSIATTDTIATTDRIATTDTIATTQSIATTDAIATTETISTTTELPTTQNERVTRHKGEKSIKCGYCPVMFYSRSRRSLYEHIQTVHRKGKRKETT